MQDKLQISLLTSGFPNGFTNEFIKCIKKYYKNNGAFVYIASDFSGHIKTDKYSMTFVKMFQDDDIKFKTVNIIDDRATKQQAIEYINQADIVWLSGGNTLKQISYINEYNLIPALQNRKGITIGMSAGSINMAKRVVLARDIKDDILELKIYDGIGLVDINIEPHIDGAKKEHLEDIRKASKEATIYGLFDNSFIKIINNEVEYIGEYIKYEKI